MSSGLRNWTEPAVFVSKLLSNWLRLDNVTAFGQRSRAYDFVSYCWWRPETSRVLQVRLAEATSCFPNWIRPMPSKKSHLRRCILFSRHKRFLSKAGIGKIFVTRCCVTNKKKTTSSFPPQSYLLLVSPWSRGSLAKLATMSRLSGDSKDTSGGWFNSVVLCRVASNVALSWSRSSSIWRDFCSSSARRCLFNKQQNFVGS